MTCICNLQDRTMSALSYQLLFNRHVFSLQLHKGFSYSYNTFSLWLFIKLSTLGRELKLTLTLLLLNNLWSLCDFGICLPSRLKNFLECGFTLNFLECGFTLKRLRAFGICLPSRLKNFLELGRELKLTLTLLLSNNLWSLCAFGICLPGRLKNLLLIFVETLRR